MLEAAAAGFTLGVLASGAALYWYVYVMPLDRSKDARDLARKRLGKL